MKAVVILYTLIVASRSIAGETVLNDLNNLENYLNTSNETNRFKTLWQQLSSAMSFAALLNSTTAGYTILVPVDGAFTDISSDVAERLDSLKYDQNRLRSFVTAHILSTMCTLRSLSDCGLAFSASPLLRVASTIEQAKTWNKLNYQPRAFFYDEAYVQLSAMSSSLKDLSGKFVFVNGATIIRELQFGSIIVHLIDEVLSERDRGVTAFAFLSPKSVATIQNCDLCKREVRALLLPSGALSRMRIRVPASIAQQSAIVGSARDTMLNVTAFEALSRLLREDQSGGVTVFFPAEFGHNFIPPLESYPDRAYRALANTIVRGHVLFTPAFRAGVLRFECLRSTLEGSISPHCALRVLRFGPLRDQLLVVNSRAVNSLTIVLPNVPLANGVVHFVDGVFVDADFEAETSEFPSCIETVRRLLASSNSSFALNDSLIEALSSSSATVFLLLPAESQTNLISVLNGSRLSYMDIIGNVKRNQVAMSGLIVRFVPIREVASPYSRNGFSKFSQQEPYEYTLVDLQLVSGMFATFRYLQPDVMCSNGFVHLITPLHSLPRRNDSSLESQQLPSLLALIASRRDLSVTLALIRALELDIVLDAQSASFAAGRAQHQLHTVFAPTDSAWFAFLARRNLTIEQLSIVFAKRNAFGRVAQRHVVLHAYRFIGVVTKDAPHIIEKQHGQYVLSTGSQSDSWFVTFNGARSYVTGNDYEAFNGVMHVLEDVLTTPIDFGIAQPAESALRVDVSGASNAFPQFSRFAIFHVVFALIVYARSTL